MPNFVSIDYYSNLRIFCFSNDPWRKKERKRDKKKKDRAKGIHGEDDSSSSDDLSSEFDPSDPFRTKKKREKAKKKKEKGNYNFYTFYWFRVGYLNHSKSNLDTLNLKEFFFQIKTLRFYNRQRFFKSFYESVPDYICDLIMAKIALPLRCFHNFF